MSVLMVVLYRLPAMIVAVLMTVIDVTANGRACGSDIVVPDYVEKSNYFIATGSSQQHLLQCF